MRYYIHNLPGRLRVQNARLRHAQCKITQLDNALAQLPGITSYQFNQKAGSILVQYDHAQVSAEDILYLMHRSGCLQDYLSQGLSERHSSVAKIGNTLGNALFGTLVKKGLETSVTSVARILI